MANDGQKVADFVNKIFLLIQTEKLDANNATYSVAYTLGVILGRAEILGNDPKVLKMEVDKAIEYARKAALDNEKATPTSTS